MQPLLSRIDRGLHFLSCYQNLCADTKGHRAVILSAAWQHQIFKINVGIRRTWDSGSHLSSFLHTGMQNKTGITDEAFEYIVRKKSEIWTCFGIWTVLINIFTYEHFRHLSWGKPFRFVTNPHQYVALTNKCQRFVNPRIWMAVSNFGNHFWKERNRRVFDAVSSSQMFSS